MSTEYNASEIDRLVREGTEDSNGFAGEFAFQPAHTEDHGIGNIADCIDIDDRLIYIPRVDADTDEYVTIASPIDRHVAEPLARMLNRHRDLVAALSAAKAEVERLMHLCETLQTSALDELYSVRVERDRLAAECERLLSLRPWEKRGISLGAKLKRAKANRDHLAAEVERLTKERDAFAGEATEYAALSEMRADKITRLSARVRELELTEEEREVLEMLVKSFDGAIVLSRSGKVRALALLDRLVKGGR